MTKPTYPLYKLFLIDNLKNGAFFCAENVHFYLFFFSYGKILSILINNISVTVNRKYHHDSFNLTMKRDDYKSRNIELKKKG